MDEEIVILDSDESEIEIEEQHRPKQITQKTKKKRHNVSRIKLILTYPGPTDPGSISINTEDFKCLNRDTFLNDTIIDFYLKYLFLEILTPRQRKKTFIFSTFFYSRLTTPFPDEPKELRTKPEIQHRRVIKWLKDVDIFEKDFLIFPMNQDSHWYLIIICFPGLVDIDCEIIDDITISKFNQNTILNVPEVIQMDQDDVIVESCSILPREQKSLTGEVVKNPCILIFDSMKKTSRAEVTQTLRNYLACEHYVKKKTQKVFSPKTLKVFYPDVPHQTSLSDCGLYVLQYVESFFERPIKNFTLPLSSLKDWFDEVIITYKREFIANLIIHLRNRGGDTSQIELPNLEFDGYETQTVDFRMGRPIPAVPLPFPNEICLLS